MAAQPTRYRFTVDEYYQMADAGIFTEDSPVELIDGEIVEMVALGGRHIRCVTMLTRLLVFAVGPNLYVSPQNSVRLDIRSEPEPDFAILRALPEGRTPPRTEDVVLVIEVADTSLLYDLNVKVPLYARAGIPELWVVDLTAPRVVQLANPEDGRYTNVAEFHVGDHVISQMIPAVNIAVADIFA